MGSSPGRYEAGVRGCDGRDGHGSLIAARTSPRVVRGEPLTPEVHDEHPARELPEVLLLIALLLSVVFWRVVQLMLTLLAVGFILLVVVGMAGYGALELLQH